jgi:hypothetical protein
MAGYPGWPGKFSKNDNVLCNVGFFLNSAWGLVDFFTVLEGQQRI